jgi:hypothetical protein
MKRSTWVSLILLGGGVGMIAYLVFGELHPAITQLGTNSAQAAEQLSQGIETRQARAEDILAKHAELKTLPAVSSALAILKSEQANAAELKKLAKTLRAQLAKNRSSEASDIRDSIFNIQSRMTSMNLALPVKKMAVPAPSKVKQAPGTAALETIESYGAWYGDFDGMIKKSLALAQSAALGPKLSNYQTQSSELTKAYPDQLDLVGGLAKRMQTLKVLDTQLYEQSMILSAATGAKAANKATIINAGMELKTTVKALESAKSEWAKATAAVPNDVDKVIIDMRSKSGVYAHKYKVITNGQSVDSGWTNVDKATFNKHKEHLGMAIYSKPAGVLPEDATVIASPPGYNYVGNRRYGQWERRNGQSFWVFYGQYSLMRDVFWGRGMYRPIYRSEYRGYRSNLRSRRAYYGAKKQYGTAKAVKSPKYSKSSYAKKRSSSGGYSGSKYSGSKRSGGYRGSRYRGSSFGGGGK